ncbi:MAG: GrpB family protein [Cyanobacteria bacterium J06649_4]
MREIKVVDYDSEWATTFEALKSRIWPAIQSVALGIEHVGSTSVPGLAAKPIIDIDIIIASEAELPVVIERLAQLGYQHRGDLGIEGREAFFAPVDLAAHHLYVCTQDSVALKNHLAVRDYLKLHPEKIQQYSELKKHLAQRFPNDIDSYIEGKTDFLLEILRAANFSSAQLASIKQANTVK